MHKGTNNNQTQTTMFFLALFEGKIPELYNGVKTREGRFGPAIVLPEIPGMKHGKNIVTLDKFNPAHVSANGKIFNAYFKLNGGTKKFADPQTFVTLAKPAENDDTKVFIVCARRFDFANTLAAEICVKAEKGTGNANGSVAPGVLVLNDGDSVKITWEGKKYTISNFEGFVHMAIEKPTPVKKEVKVKPAAAEVVVDNRVKVEGNLTVVGKIDLNPKKVEKPVEVPVVAEVKKPAVKQTAKKPEKKKFFKKGPGDNGNHFVAADVPVPEYVPATEGLGSVAGADKLTAMLTEMEQGKGKKGAKKGTRNASKKKTAAA